MTCIDLRSGHGEPLFLFPGAGGDAAELQALAETLETRRPLVGVEPFGPPGSWDEPPLSIEAMAGHAVSLIRERQARGPYYLLGYSFGGLVALEVSQALRSDGQAVPFLGLVDVIYDRRYWPFRLFASSLLRRTGRHLQELATERSARSWRNVSRRVHRLARELASHAGLRTDEAPENRNRKIANYAAMAEWRPRTIVGPAVLFTSGDGSDFACDPDALWRPWISELEVRRVAGSHLGLVRDSETVGGLAETVDLALVGAETPPLRVLLATTFGWESAWRLAIELKNVGCTVDAVAPRNSALHCLSPPSTTYPLGRVRPLQALRAAIIKSRADLIIPFDDRTRRALHLVHEKADGSAPLGVRLRSEISRSLGPSASYSRIYSRSYVMAVAADCGLKCPATRATTSLTDASDFIAQHGAAVLKTDGSWGGREVVVARNRAEAGRAWRRLSRPPSVATIAKRWLIDRDPWPLRERVTGHRRLLSIQTYVDGRPANVAAACLDGRLLGAVQAEVVHSYGEFGPSSVIRVIENPEMLAAAKALIARLRLTGLVGLDFVLDRKTGNAEFVELNPRATPTAHLLPVDGTDPLTSLREALGRSGPPPRTCAYPEGLVALYPLEMQRDPTSPFLTTAFHDVPVERADPMPSEQDGSPSGDMAESGPVKTYVSAHRQLPPEV